MSGDEVDSLSFQLGGIKSSLEMILRTLSEDREASARYRTDIRNDLADTRKAISTVEKDLLIAKNDIADIKPKVTMMEQNRQQSVGVSNFIFVVGKFAHAISAAIGGLIVFALQHWYGGSK